MADEKLSPEEFENLPEDKEDETPKGEPETPVASSGDETGEKEEPKVPLSRLREERQKREQIEKELRRLQTETRPSPSGEGRTEDEKERLRKVLEEIQEEEEKEYEQAEAEFNQVLSDLKLADPTLDENFLISLMEKYEVYNLDAAYRLYQDFKGKPGESSKFKSPSGSRTSDETPKETPSYSGALKSMMDVRGDIRREYGV